MEHIFEVFLLFVILFNHRCIAALKGGLFNIIKLDSLQDFLGKMKY